MTTIAVTGCAGYLGRKLLLLLDTDDAISRVVGIDVAEPSFATRNLEFYRMDVRSPDLSEVFAGCDAVVHLAAVAGGEQTLSVNVGGTRSVADAAGAAGVRKLVLASSGAVYGAHSDNPVPLAEETPVRPAEGYPASKAEAEGVVGAFAQTHPDVVVTVLRLAWVCGPTVPGSKAQVIESPLRLAIEGYDPPLQAVHEDDAAAALAFVLRNDLRGTYNVCADDWVEHSDRLLNQVKITLGIDRARRWADGASRAGLISQTSAALPVLMHSTVMSNGRLRDKGFTFEHSSADALRAARQARRGWVRVGRVRFRPRWMAAAAVGAAAVAIGSAARARRAKD